MTPASRRENLIDILVERGSEKASVLAVELEVSVDTIYRDVNKLSSDYPIYTLQGKFTGGIFIEDGYRRNRKFLSREEKAALERAIDNASKEDKKLLKRILVTFKA